MGSGETRFIFNDLQVPRFVPAAPAGLVLSIRFGVARPDHYPAQDHLAPGCSRHPIYQRRPVELGCAVDLGQMAGALQPAGKLMCAGFRNFGEGTARAVMIADLYALPLARGHSAGKLWESAKVARATFRRLALCILHALPRKDTQASCCPSPDRCHRPIPGSARHCARRRGDDRRPAPTTWSSPGSFANTGIFCGFHSAVVR